MNNYEFSGKGVSNNADGTPVIMPTIGSILCVDPALDLSIDAQYSNMSGGQFNMQFDIQLENQSTEEVTPTIYLVVVNSGLFCTENGSSSLVTGVLNQEMVLETKTQDAVSDSHTYSKKIIGGSIENLNSIHKHLKGSFSKASEKEKLIDSDGGGMSAGGMSAGGMNNTDFAPAVSGKQRRIHKHASK